MMSINVMARSRPRCRRDYRPCLRLRCQSCRTVVVDDDSVAKMSGGDVDVEPYLNSRNTIGHGIATQILKAQCGKNATTSILSMLYVLFPMI